MANKKVLLKRSNALVDGNPKAPSAESMDYGELAINYKAGSEALFAKNSDNEVVNLLSNDATVAALATAMTDHINDHDNPHNVSKSDVGLGNVDNTSDANKPVSTAQATAIAGKLDVTGGIVNNLTTNSTTQALSAAQGIVLAQQIADAAAGSSADTQAVQAQLTAIGNRVSAVEEEVDGAEDIEDTIIAKEDSMIADYSE